MKEYKQLRDELFEHVSEIDIKKLGLGYCGLKDYAELLITLNSMPIGNVPYGLDMAVSQCCCQLNENVLSKMEEAKNEGKN